MFDALLEGAAVRFSAGRKSGTRPPAWNFWVFIANSSPICFWVAAAFITNSPLDSIAGILSSRGPPGPETNRR